MSEHIDSPDPPDDEVEAILESLPELRRPTEPSFRKALRKQIYQTEAASQMGHLSWAGLWRVVLEYLGALLGFFHAHDRNPPDKGD